MNATTDPIINNATYSRTVGAEYEEATMIGVKRLEQPNGQVVVRGRLYTESFGAIQVTEGDTSFVNWKLIHVPEYHGLEIVEEEIEPPLHQPKVDTVRKVVAKKAPARGKKGK